MSFDVEGLLYKKFDVQQITDTFKKREFVLKIEDGMYPQLVKFQLTQNNCEKLDPFNEEEQIKVTFSLRGREHTKDDKTNYYTNLDAWRLEKVGTTSAAAAPPQAADAFPSAGDEPSSDANDDLPF